MSGTDPWAEFRVQAAPQADPWAEFRAPAQRPATRERTAYGSVPAPSWVPAPIARAADFLGGITRQGQRALTFGMRDEMQAGANAIGQAAATGQPAAQAYDAELPRVRAEQQAFERDNPAASIAAQVAAGVAMPLGATRAMSLPGAMVRGAATGAALGGAAGFGEAQGGIDARLAGAATGAAVGGAIGGAAPLVISGVGRAAEAVGRRLGVQDPGAAAQRLTLRELSRDGVTPEDALTRLREAGDAPVMLADVAGENTRGAAAMVARVPGEGRALAARNIEARSGAAQSARLADTVRGNISADDFTATVNATIARRASEAAPLYDEAYGVVLPRDLRLQRFLNDPDIRAGIRQGVASARREALAADRAFDLRDLGVRFTQRRMPDGTMADDIQLVGGGTPTRLFDAAKRGLDGMIEAARNAGERSRVRELTSIRNSMLAEVDRLNPAFARARAAYAGQSELLDAARTGRELLQMRPGDFEEVLQDIAQFSPQQREFLRLGVARDMVDRLANTVGGADQTRLNRIFNNEQVATRLRAVFDNEDDFRRFAASMERELSMAQTNRAVSPSAGSQTMPLQERRADWASPPSGPVTAALVDPDRASAAGMPSAPVMADLLATWRAGGMTAAPARLLERAQQGMTARAFERNANAAAPYLLTTDPAQREALARALLERYLRDQRVAGATQPLAAALMRGAPVAGSLTAND